MLIVSLSSEVAFLLMPLSLSVRSSVDEARHTAVSSSDPHRTRTPMMERARDVSRGGRTRAPPRREVRLTAYSVSVRTFIALQYLRTRVTACALSFCKRAARCVYRALLSHTR